MSTEGRVLITLDLDFCDIRAYPPDESCGKIVLRYQQQGREYTLREFTKILAVLDKNDLTGKLWIVDEYKIRERI